MGRLKPSLHTPIRTEQGVASDTRMSLNETDKKLVNINKCTFKSSKQILRTFVACLLFDVACTQSRNSVDCGLVQIRSWNRHTVGIFVRMDDSVARRHWTSSCVVSATWSPHQRAKLTKYDWMGQLVFLVWHILNNDTSQPRVTKFVASLRSCCAAAQLRVYVCEMDADARRMFLKVVLQVHPDKLFRASPEQRKCNTDSLQVGTHIPWHSCQTTICRRFDAMLMIQILNSMSFYCSFHFSIHMYHCMTEYLLG